MGTPLPANEPGDQCTICWGSGKPFGPGPTPRFVRATFEGLLFGFLYDDETDPQPNRTFLLKQYSPCVWAYSTTEWFVSWKNLATYSKVEAGYNGYEEHFDGQSDDICGLEFENSYQSPIGVVYYSGTCKISWDKEGLE